MTGWTPLGSLQRSVPVHESLSRKSHDTFSLTPVRDKGGRYKASIAIRLMILEARASAARKPANVMAPAPLEMGFGEKE